MIILNKKDRLIVELNEEGSITYVNKKFRNLTGFENEELLNKKYIKFLNRDFSEDLFDSAINAAKKGEFWEGYLKNETKDNNCFWTKVNFQKKEKGFIIKQTYATEENIKLMEKEYKTFSKGMTIRSSNCGLIPNINK